MIRKTRLVLITLLLIACASKGKVEPNSHVTPSDRVFSADTVATTHGKDEKLLPNSMRIKFDVDEDGRVQNMQILESTATQEVERKVISKIKNEWRYEKGKPRMDLRIIATLRPLKR